VAESAGNTASEVIPAGHPAPQREPQGGGEPPPASPAVAGLSLAALGVVFGDIGTSPIYTSANASGRNMDMGPTRPMCSASCR
jgi:hypothetical protein